MAACAFTEMLRRSRNRRAVELELQAEKETREAIIAAAIAGADAVVLEAIASDPVPVGALDDRRSDKGHRRKHL